MKCWQAELLGKQGDDAIARTLSRNASHLHGVFTETGFGIISPEIILPTGMLFLPTGIWPNKKKEQNGGRIVT